MGEVTTGVSLSESHRMPMKPGPIYDDKKLF